MSDSQNEIHKPVKHKKQELKIKSGRKMKISAKGKFAIVALLVLAIFYIEARKRPSLVETSGIESPAIGTASGVKIIYGNNHAK